MSELQMLPAWLDAGAATLAGAVPPAPTLAGALPGLAQAQSLTPLAAAAARAGVGPGRMRRRRRTDLSRLAAIPARPRAFGAGDRRDRPRRAGTRRGRRSRQRSLAAGRGRADRCRPARQPQGRAAPAGRADRPRSGLPECGRRHPFARPGRRLPAGRWRCCATAGRVAGARDRPPTGHGWSTRRRPGAGSPCCSPARRASMRRC